MTIPFQYQLHTEVIYFNRKAYVVGVRWPGRHETGLYYDLAREPQTSKPSFYNVHESKLSVPSYEDAPVCELKIVKG